MQAAICCGPRDIRVEDVPMPELAEDELLVRIKACGICGSDLQQSDPLQARDRVDRWARADRSIRGQGGHTDTAANSGHLSGHKHMAEPIADF